MRLNMPSKFMQIQYFPFRQATKSYELLNYSEFGSMVNGQLYSCDFTEYPQLSDHRVADPNGIYEIVQSMLDKKRGVKRINYKGNDSAV